MTKVRLEEVDFAKLGGLVPVVVQDATTREVLMVAFANREALAETLRTGYAHYFSRSRGKLWKKGRPLGMSSAFERFWSIAIGIRCCTLVEQTGVACHRGTRSCFTDPLLEQDATLL
jgi:phosphoribosyl-AMP cyclohydrolase